jgi:tRNA nucleotidyltransferase (CCA-adding enzyme)
MEVIQQIAKKISEHGGRTFYVGGFVRDALLQIPHEDIDLEVFHLSLRELTHILEQFGPVDHIGKNFGVLRLTNYPQLDFSLPRKEIKKGPHHTDFEITIAKNLPYIEAARRRDFTANALMQDVLTGEILDFFAGIVDIKSRILRHVDDARFGEDALRGLRAAQFAVRFNFSIDLETQELIRGFYYDALSDERIQAELQKGFFSFNARHFLFLLFELRVSEQRITPLTQLKTMQAEKYDNTLELLEQIDQLHYEAALAQPLKLTALIFYLPKTAAIEVLKTFGTNQTLCKHVLALQRAIQQTQSVNTATDARRLKNNLPDTTQYWIFLSHLALIDKNIIAKQFKNLEDYQRFFLMSIKNNPGSAPLIQGRDLIALGFSPDKDFSDLLRYARALEEEGLDKKSIETELTRAHTDVKH